MRVSDPIHKDIGTIISWCLWLIILAKLGMHIYPMLVLVLKGDIITMEIINLPLISADQG